MLYWWQTCAWKVLLPWCSEIPLHTGTHCQARFHPLTVGRTIKTLLPRHRVVCIVTNSTQCWVIEHENETCLHGPSMHMHKREQPLALTIKKLTTFCDKDWQNCDCDLRLTYCFTLEWVQTKFENVTSRRRTVAPKLKAKGTSYWSKKTFIANCFLP